MQQVTLGFSVHRPEMISIIYEMMKSHEAVFLEEPPSVIFQYMLQGNLSVTDYLYQIDAEYPEFSGKMCNLLRKLYATGKIIHQIEPFLEILLGIHAFFAEGHSPDDLDKDSIQYPVYLTERNATGALLSYYRAALNGSFEQAIESTIKFARMDAARFRLRDSLRAQELSQIVIKYPSSYVEAGLIHYPLWRLLKRSLSPQVNVNALFHPRTALDTGVADGHLYGPGDRLTLLYVFHPETSETRRQRELAARSLIYSKIVKKEELSSDRNNFPHIRDELCCIKMTRQLDLDDCRKLFPLVRQAKTSEARQIVTEYIVGTEVKKQKLRKWSSSG